jgi:nucleoside-diphosphate kinase
MERKGLRLAGIKMLMLNDEILNIHYNHLRNKPFFAELKESMMRTPVIVQCWEGTDAISVVRRMIGITDGRQAAPGTIRGDYSISIQENIVHASDSIESAKIELDRFFANEELYDYKFID